MFGAIFIGLSGLNAYSRGLQQVSNNVSNLNSQGFRASIVGFDNQQRGSSGNGYTIDSPGSGAGVGLAETRLDMRAGELRQTDRDLDLAVDGSGFLVLLKGDEVAYTRTGSFEVDEDGFIVLAGTEYRLATLDASNHPVSLSINAIRDNAPKATTTIKLSGNLSGTPVVNDIAVYDSSGNRHVWKIEFTKVTPGPTDPPTPGVDEIWKAKISDGQGFTQEKDVKIFSNNVMTETRTLVFGPAGGPSVTVDFSQIRTFTGSPPSVQSVDGYAAGSLARVFVNDKGSVELSYSNEQKVELGAVALADFRDPQALEQESAGLFSYSGSGRQLMSSADERVGLVKSNRLEASNVDLSQQFGELILIQRGFQASSQIISASNDMIQQLFGIRGQG